MNRIPGSGIARVLGSAGLVLLTGVLTVPLRTVFAAPPQSRFYDFTETVITGQQRVPGLEFILGDKIGGGDCDGLEADDFRRCLGEVRDVFRYIPRSEAQQVDVVVIPFGKDGLSEAWRLSSAISRGPVHDRADSRLMIHPVPSMWGAHRGTVAKNLPDFVTVNRLTRSAAERTVKAYVKAAMGVGGFSDPSRSLYNMLTTQGNGLLREGAHLGLVMYARQMPDTALFPSIVARLNERFGPAGWGATVVCEPDVCHGFDPFTRRPGGRIIPIGSKESREATKHAVEDAVWQANRWTLSHNPGLSGFLELRSSDRVLEPRSYAYDPFERRVRIAGRNLPFDEQRRIEAWYFPFNPLQALAKVCPQAVEKKGQAGSALPCRDWVADEMVSPQPHPRIEVRAVGLSKEEAQLGKVMEKQFRDVMDRRNVELAWSQPGTPWRLDTFRIVLCMNTAGCESHGADAVIPWMGGLDLDTMQTTAWRALNRSTRIPITGFPLVYDTLKVYLNGRAIVETTRDGAGFVLKGSSLYLDVAAPLHPDSHVFVVYRRDGKGK